MHDSALNHGDYGAENGARQVSETGPQTGMEGPRDGADGGKPQPSVQAVQMLRTAQVNTMMLSQMADQKASILMGATFLVFSIAVSRSLAGDLPWSLALLAIFAFLSSGLAVVAVIPSIGKPKTVARPNLMFFGHFSERDEDEWTDEVIRNLADDESVYRVMLHDIYQNGQVLHRRKYLYLRYAYSTFVFGLIATLISFAIEFSNTY